MVEMLTEDQVAGLLTILRKDVSVDTKVQHITAVKSAIKHYSVPDVCVAPLFEALRLASSSQHLVLVNAGFTTLNHLLTRMSLQEPKFLAKEAKHTLPLIVEKMGDQKDKIRGLAIQAMATMYNNVPIDAERFMRNTAMVGKNPRSKESSLQWLLQMHRDQGLQFRAYVPALMELLEDADGMVRDATKSTVIELFRDAPNGAKTDLKKQLKNFKVRPAIEQAIVKELAPTSSKTDPESRPASAMQVRTNLAASVSSLASERPITPMPEPKAESVEPSYVNTNRELEDLFRDMHPFFEGKETEHNWLKREESITKLRRLIAGNVPSDFPETFIAGCRALLDGIIKAANSLRTSLSKEGCALVQDLANTFGPAIDPMVELLMQTFIKLCAATKKISSQLANTSVDIIIGRTTYNARIMQHIWGACQDKNVSPRMYATGWLKTLLKKEAHHKNHLEHGGGLDMIEKCIKKGLNDPNPGVREKMRSTYWAYAAIWPAKAEAIMDGLESTAQKLLQKDPNNPNSPKKSEPAPRPGLGLSKSTMASSKPSLRDAMMAQKRALTSKNLPSRPGSAMATVTPVRNVSGGSSGTSATSHAASTSAATRTRADTSTKSHGGMSVAPMRPARRRPDVAPRPATAGPYSVRSHDGPSREQTSPSYSTKQKAATPKTIVGSPRRTVPRTRPGHVATASESSISTPSKEAAHKTAASPKASPAKPSPVKAKPTANEITSSSPSNSNEDFTLVVPDIAQLKESIQIQSIPLKLSPKVLVVEAPTIEAPPVEAPLVEIPIVVEDEEVTVVHKAATPAPTPSKSLKVYEDPFTEDDQPTPRPAANGIVDRPVLEDKPINEDAANFVHPAEANEVLGSPFASPDKTRQNSRLIDSGIARVKAQSLDVHGFRKLQSLVRDTKVVLPDDKFDALILGLFEYLESSLDSVAPEKVQDVKAQILATIKLLLKKSRDRFQPHVSRGLEALLAARTRYDARTHIVSGLELLADELVTIGDEGEITVTMTRNLSNMDMDTSGHRSLSMGLHVLKELLDARSSFTPSESEVTGLLDLATRCLESKESGVRMDAVQLCVALHARLGETRFWESMKNVKDDPKSLITYYIVKRQRENGGVAA